MPVDKRDEVQTNLTNELAKERNQPHPLGYNPRQSREA